MAWQLDDSSSGVDIGDDIGQPGDRLNEIEWNAVKCGVFVFEPIGCDTVIAGDNAVERALEAHQHDGEFEGLLSAIESVLALTHA